VLLLDDMRLQIPLDPPGEPHPVYECEACGGGIYLGMEQMTDSSGNVYHLKEKCLAEGIKRNLPALDGTVLREIFTKYCEGMIDEAW